MNSKPLRSTSTMRSWDNQIPIKNDLLLGKRKRLVNDSSDSPPAGSKRIFERSVYCLCEGVLSVTDGTVMKVVKQKVLTTSSTKVVKQKVLATGP